MNDKNQYRVSAGGIILLIALSFSLLSITAVSIGNMINYAQGGIMGVVTGLTQLVGTLVSAVPMLIFAILLTAKKHGKSLIVVSAIGLGTHLLFVTFRTAGNLVSLMALAAPMLPASIANLLSQLLYDAFLLALLLLCVKAAGKDPCVARKMKAVPGWLYILYSAAAVVASLMPTLQLQSHLNSTALLMVIIPIVIGSVLGAALPTVGWFLAGGWIAYPYKKDARPQMVGMGTAAEQGRYPDPARLKELEQYQQMLASGVISQEEYDAIRIRVLGL